MGDKHLPSMASALRAETISCLTLNGYFKTEGLEKVGI